MTSTASVAVLLKRVDLRPVIDPLTGAITADEHGGLSAADECALELALRQAVHLAHSLQVGTHVQTHGVYYIRQ